MIKIVSGVYGQRVGKFIMPISPEHEPIELDAAEETRLVELGVAEYVGEAVAAPNEGSGGKPAYNVSMKLAELKEIAKAYSVDAETLKSKAEVCAAIDAALAADGESDLDDMPTFGDPGVVG